jgi:hypothetical protein
MGRDFQHWGAGPQYRGMASTLLLLLSFNACGGASAVPSSKPTPTPSPLARPQAGHVYWLLTRPALDMILPDPRTRAVLDGPTSFVTVTKLEPTLPSGWRAVPTAIFASYRAIVAAFARGTLPAGTRAILYDNEMWSDTPSQEQRNPAHYEMLTANLVHSHGLVLISAPAVDLVQVLQPATGPVFPRYLALGIAADAARYADIVDIQAQGSEDDTAKFADFIGQATAQARAANPNVIVLAGISTTPSGKSITEAQLIAAVNNTRTMVDGYWLNIPVPGGTCQRCTIARPDLAMALIDHLAAPSP